MPTTAHDFHVKNTCYSNLELNSMLVLEHCSPATLPQGFYSKVLAILAVRVVLQTPHIYACCCLFWVQALLAQKIRAMQQQRHELLPAAQHETGTATGPSSSALGGDAVEGRSCMQQSASEAAGSEAGNESDDHSSSSASSDITARSNPRAQRGTVPAAAARHKHKKTQKPYHARYVFRKSGDGEGVQKSALQVVHLEFASKVRASAVTYQCRLTGFFPHPFR